MSPEAHVRFDGNRRKFPLATLLVPHLGTGRPGPEPAGEYSGTARADLQPDKTRIVDLHHGVQSFDFLGFHHRMVASWKRPVATGSTSGCHLALWPPSRLRSGNADPKSSRRGPSGPSWKT